MVFQSTILDTEKKMNQSDANETAKHKAQENNTKVVNYMTMGQKNDKIINVIELSKTGKYPSGVACLIWAELEPSTWGVQDVHTLFPAIK